MLGNERCSADGSGEIFSHLMPGLLECPELTSGLEVMTPATVFTLADEAGQQVSERRIVCDEVYLAEEVFFAGTAAEVFPVPGLDGSSGLGSRPLLQKNCRRRASVRSWVDGT